MGDTTSGVLPGGCFRRVSASFGRVDPRPSELHLYRAMLWSTLHPSGAAPRSPKVGSWMVRGRGVGRRRGGRQDGRRLPGAVLGGC